MSSAAVSDGRACRVYALVQLHAVDGGEARRPRTARPETHHAVRKTRPITVLRRSSAADGTRTVDTMDAVITPQRGRSPHVLCAVRRETLRLAAALVIPVMTARLALPSCLMARKSDLAVSHTRKLVVACLIHTTLCTLTCTITKPSWWPSSPPLHTPLSVEVTSCS